MTYYTLTKDMPMLTVQHGNEIIGGIVHRTDIGTFDVHFYPIHQLNVEGWTKEANSFDEGEKLIRNTFAYHTRKELNRYDGNKLQKQLTLY